MKISGRSTSCSNVGMSSGSSSVKSNHAGGDQLVPEDNLRNKKKHTEFWRDKDPSSFFKIASWQAEIFIALRSYCLLFVPGSVLRHFDAILNWSTPLSQLLYHPGLLFRFRFSFLSFSKVFCPQTNAVGLNLKGSPTAHSEPSSTPPVMTSFYGPCDSIYIINHSENNPHCTNLQI